MPDWKKSLVGLNATIRNAVITINDGGLEIALVADENGKLFGTVTDGDVRRGLLRGLDMDAPVATIMNAQPFTAPSDTPSEALLRHMTDTGLRQIPLVEDSSRVVGLIHIRDLTPPIGARGNWVVLMAGGLGTRLRPLTRNIPKPLLTVGDKPILETIFKRFVDQKFRRFYISVNYRAEAIKEHFGDGHKWDVEIRYLEEDQRLGTAGALKLIRKRPEMPIIVMNGDLLTRINFQDLLDYHVQQKSKATMCVRQYDVQVPFGVIGIDGNRLRSIDEKPVQRFLVNAGIYVLDPALIGLISDDRAYDMTDLFATVIAEGGNTTAFPIHEYWVDIGRIDDLDRAKLDYDNGLDS